MHGYGYSGRREELGRPKLSRRFPIGPYPGERRIMIPIQPPRCKGFRERFGSFRRFEDTESTVSAFSGRTSTVRSHLEAVFRNSRFLRAREANCDPGVLSDSQNISPWHRKPGLAENAVGRARACDERIVARPGATTTPSLPKPGSNKIARSRASASAFLNHQHCR